MSSFEIVVAKVKEVKGPASPVVRKILKEEQNQTLDNTPDDKHIYWVDVKKTYPELEQQLKTLFAGKDKISVKELREQISKVPAEDAKFWLSKTTWDSELQRELGTDHHQIVVQLNMSKSIIDTIHTDPIASAFFKEASRMLSSSGMHPTHSQSIAWARVYPMPDKWIIEEIQSDLFGATPKLREMANSSVDKIIDHLGLSESEKKHLQDFFLKHFVDWDKKLVATIISMARKEGAKDVWMFDEDLKAKHLQSASKLDRFYKVVPRDLGFKRDKLMLDDRQLSGWHRLVASTHLKRIGAVEK